MNWDDFAEMAEAEAAAAPPPDQLCPDGVHVAEIKFARELTKEWFKTDRNTAGKCLALTMSVRPGIKDVYDDIPADRRGKLESLCLAVGLAIPRGDWDERQLVGRMVTIETALRVSKRGNDYVAVVKYKPGPKPLPAEVRERASRTPTQKADAAASMPNDDIPF